jgi:hypothetical protein
VIKELRSFAMVSKASMHCRFLWLSRSTMHCMLLSGEVRTSTGALPTAAACGEKGPLLAAAAAWRGDSVCASWKQYTSFVMYIREANVRCFSRARLL